MASHPASLGVKDTYFEDKNCCFMSDRLANGMIMFFL